MSASSKRVRVTIELSQTFVRLLQANVELGAGLVPAHAQDPTGVLARAVYAEARGAYEHQVALIVPPEWRAHLDVIHEERKVIE